MAGDVLVRLAGPMQLSNAAATVYTVPSATTTTIRSIIIHNSSGSAVTFTISIGADAAGTRVWNAFSLDAGRTWEFDGVLVLAATEIVQAKASTASVMQFTMSGVESS